MESLGAETTQDTVKLLRETNDPLVLGLMAFAAVVAAPLCEEIVFRGYLYPVLRNSPASARRRSAPRCFSPRHMAISPPCCPC